MWSTNGLSVTMPDDVSRTDAADGLLNFLECYINEKYRIAARTGGE
jgi:hypothetical protein